MNNSEKYSFKHSQKNYPVLFLREKQKLQKILGEIGKRVVIEHIGSTAVPGLGGKGIIDIMVLMPKARIERGKELLWENLFGSCLNDSPDRLFFYKDYAQKGKGKGKTRRVHVHLTSNKKNLEDCAAFKDYLIRNPLAVKKYAEIKKEAAKLCKGEGSLYRDCKKRFIDKITNLASK